MVRILRCLHILCDVSFIAFYSSRLKLLYNVCHIWTTCLCTSLCKEKVNFLLPVSVHCTSYMLHFDRTGKTTLPLILCFIAFYGSAQNAELPYIQCSTLFYESGCATLLHCFMNVDVLHCYIVL